MDSKMESDVNATASPANNGQTTHQNLRTSDTRVKTRKRSKRPKLSISVCDTRLADAALRQAAEGGYLISPSRAFLLER